MATTLEYTEFVCEQIQGIGAIRYRKMFGEYMVYVNDKPLLLLCDNCTYIKKHPAIETWMQDAQCATPYHGAKEHYVLDVEDANAKEVLLALEALTPLPKPRTQKKKK